MPARSEERTQFLKDVLVTAVEGGVTSWVERIRNYKPDDGTVTLVYENPNAQGSLTKDLTIEDVARGLARICDGSAQCGNRDHIKRAYDEMESGDIDADDADCIVQVAVLGEIVFG